MSRDLKEIFDLDQLRRTWGGQDAAASPTSPRSEKVAPPPISESDPQRILEKLEEAIGQEYDSAQLPLFRPTLEAVRALFGLAEARELSAARHADLERHLDELEDLLDALSLPAPVAL